jgi:hypothetical protein
MRNSSWVFGLCLSAALAAPVWVGAQGAAVMRDVDPMADMILKQANAHLQETTTASFRLMDTIDDVQEDGQKLQFGHVRTISIVRPDKLKVEVVGDVTNRTFWKDGKMLTLMDNDHGIYAELPDPGSIDQAIDMLQDDYDMSMPGVDLIKSDVYATMIDNSLRVDYVGEGLVGDEKCHHLAFVGDAIDWQLWVSAGDVPKIRKLVITYKEVPGEPQYTLQLLDVLDASTVTEATFTPVLPEGARKVEFRPVEQVTE